MKNIRNNRKLVPCFVLMALLAVSAHAQTNPKAGYIITNSNDTVRGTIDYRTNARNSHNCLFKAEGNAEFTSYTPNDIQGYRLLDNGAYFVKRTVAVNGEMKTIFAEYLLQGGVSLYHHKENSVDYYYLADKDGNTATISEDHQIYLNKDDRRDAQRKKLAEAAVMLGRSPQTLKQLWDAGELSAEKMVRIVGDYNAQNAPGTGSIVFESKSKATRLLIVRPRVEAGLQIVTPIAKSFIHEDDMKLNGIAPSVGIGIDVAVPQLSKNIEFQLLAAYSHTKATGDTKSYGIKKDTEVKFSNVGFQLGAMYRFVPEAKISPLVRGGMSLDLLFGYDTKNFEGYYGNNHNENYHQTVSVGFYVGAGGDMAIGKHKLSLTGNYVYRNYGHYPLKAPMFTINLGLVL